MQHFKTSTQHNNSLHIICDDQLFVKPTKGGRAYIDDIVEAAPYCGASMYFLMEDKFEDREWIGGLVRITAQELPIPKQERSKIRGD